MRLVKPVQFRSNKNWDCELTEYDLEKIPESIVMLAYWYEYVSYEGKGYALVKYNDGTYWIRDLRHCSCYGPWDRDFPKTGDMSLEQLQALRGKGLRGENIIEADDWDIKALLGLWQAVDMADAEGWID